MSYEEAIGLWASSRYTCSAFTSLPIWQDGIPSLYLYSGYIATLEGSSDRVPILSFRGFLDGAKQYGFEESDWPPTLFQMTIDQNDMKEYTDFSEYVFTSILTDLRLKYALS